MSTSNGSIELGVILGIDPLCWLQRSPLVRIPSWKKIGGDCQGLVFVNRINAIIPQVHEPPMSLGIYVKPIWMKHKVLNPYDLAIKLVKVDSSWYTILCFVGGLVSDIIA